MHTSFANPADFILVLHAALVFFNIGALPVIWIGYFRHWSFVRNFYFRIIHLVLVGIVAAEAVLGVVCPLTAWEAVLRSESEASLGKEAFIAHWVHRLLFYDFPDWVFTVAYLLFLLLVAWTYYVVRPGHPRPTYR